MPPNARPFTLVLDRALQDLVEGPVAIALASCRDDLTPELAQCLGCRVLADGRIVLVVVRSQAQGVLECIEAGQGVAAVFSRPSTYQTVQVKGRSATCAPARRADLETVERYRRTFAADLDGVGFGGRYAEALLAGAPEELIAVTFAPVALFEQTPGPDAGRALGSAAGEE